MSRIIAVANQKGGVGKTTTTINLAASLAALEHSCLLVDCDAQGNASSGLGADRDADTGSLYDVLRGEASLVDIIQPTGLPALKLAPSGSNLNGVDMELLGADDRALRLRAALEAVREGFEYILLDCPPSLGVLTANALTAADAVLVPVQCEYFALEGLGQLLQTIEMVRQDLNPALALEGAVLTMYDGRTRLAQQVIREVRAHFKEHVFRTVIPRNVRLSEAPSFGKPALLYDIKSPGAIAYLALARELLRKHAPAGRAGQTAPAPVGVA
jgi:chromosome partitioning protein